MSAEIARGCARAVRWSVKMYEAKGAKVDAVVLNSDYEPSLKQAALMTSVMGSFQFGIGDVCERDGKVFLAGIRVRFHPRMPTKMVLSVLSNKEKANEG